MAQRRAGWYFWYPFLMGGFMLALGIAFAVGAAGSGVGGLWGAAAVEILIGVGILFWAFWARRDIQKPEPDAEIPGTQSESVTREVQATGLPGQATITSFGFVSGSTKNGTTLVNLGLDVTTARGGPVELTHQDRVPLDLSQRLHKGIVLPCQVSSTDPSKIILDWQSATV